jgi:hypothetical protein
MPDFSDWDSTISTPGFRKALLAYGRANRGIKPKGRLPTADLEDMASCAIRSTKPEFSLEDRNADMGSVRVHCFAGYYWAANFADIHGPFDDFEEAVNTVLSIAVSSAPEGFYKRAYGSLNDDFIADRCKELVEPGCVFVINNSAYVRTDAGLVKK